MDESQRLVDAPRPPDGHPTSWHVQAAYAGDFTALVAAALRAERSHR
ncbi:MAG: hypothetical protein ACJ780_15950 [Solirubrobacteraceae bacterium]